MNTRAAKALRLGFQAALALLGLSAIASGMANLVNGADVLGQFFDLSNIAVDPALGPILDVQVRVMSGMWIGVGVGLVWTVRHFERHTLMIRVALLGFVLSALGDLLSVIEHGALAQRMTTTILLQITFYVFMEIFRHFAAKAR